MMDNEIKVVTRQETFNDLAVRELAKGRAACICRMQFKRCAKTDCPNCRIYKQYKNCYSVMNDYDKTRLASYVGDYYTVYSYHPEQWMDHEGFKKYMFKWLKLIILGFLFLMLLAVVRPMDQPRQTPKYSSRPIPEPLKVAVQELLKKSQPNITDINADGLVNCIDYTLSFKLLWDYYFPDNRDQCQIIRNYNPGHMNHLFVAIKYRGNWYFIETWTKILDELLVDDIWGKDYNPLYNVWGETNQWLDEAYYGYKGAKLP